MSKFLFLFLCYKLREEKIDERVCGRKCYFLHGFIQSCLFSFWAAVVRTTVAPTEPPTPPPPPTIPSALDGKETIHTPHISISYSYMIWLHFVQS